MGKKNPEKRKKDEFCYVTRASFSTLVYVFPATVGIRKFNGCVWWGAAWCKTGRTVRLSSTGKCRIAKTLIENQCRKRFGFYPGPGTAYLVDGSKRTKVDIDFSN